MKGRSDTELLKEFRERLASSEKHMRQVMERVERARLVAKGQTSPLFGKARDPDDPRDWRSRSFPPVAREKWELKCAELTVERPRVQFSASDPQYADNERLAEDALDYHYEIDRFDQTYRMAMRAATRDGGAPIRTSWKNDMEPSFDEDGLPELAEDGSVVMRPTRSYLCNELLRLEDIFPDPTSNTFRKCAYVTIRSYASTEDLYQARMQDGSHFYREKALAEIAKVPAGGGDADDKQRGGETTESFEARRRGVHTIHEQLTPHSRLVVANRSVILRWDPVLPTKHGSIPLTMIRTIEHEDSIVGETMLNLIDGLQEMYWHFFNGLADAVSLALDPPMIANTEEDPGAAKQSIYPGAVLEARAGQQTLHVMQDVSSLSKYDARGVLGLILELMDRVSGMNAALAGMSNASTATESAINVRQGKGRIGYELIVSDDSWCEVARKGYATIQQYQSDSVTRKLAGGREVSFDPEQLQDMMIAPVYNVDERILKDLERQDASTRWEIAQGTMSDPMSQMPQLDYTKALRRVWRAMGGDEQEVLPPAPPAPMPAAPMAGDDLSVEGGAEYLDEDGNPIDAQALDPENTQPRPEQVNAGAY